MLRKFSIVALVLSILVACSAQTGTPVDADAESQTQRQDQPKPQAEPAVKPHPAQVLEEVVVTGQMQHDVATLKKRFSTKAEIAHQASMRHAGLPYHPPIHPPIHAQDNERYPDADNNPVKWTQSDPVSTFSIDVDTAAYANIRRMLSQGVLPPTDAVRVEEMINYFKYAYPKAEDASVPFSLYTEVGPSPWHSDRKLLHVGINGWQPEAEATLPPANLVFLIDVSGSMQSPNKIGLLKQAMKLVARQLRPEDTLSIAVYAGASGQALAPTSGDKKADIEQAIDQLQAGGSTNGEAGIRLAYSMARQQFKSEGINRVILATDGDFNVGTTDLDELERLVEKERQSGVDLSVLGFGTGNYNDALMQKIAQVGNGNAAYIDTIHEARKVLVDELGATLQTIARDVKIQLEFNPKVVESYRLIGYETRHLNREDFNNDKVDAGEIGSGHTVTALYELTLVGEAGAMADPLRYQDNSQKHSATTIASNELGFLKLRYKPASGGASKLIEQPLMRDDVQSELGTTSQMFRFSAAVAWLGQLLREDKAVADENMDAMIELARAARGQDPHGYRSEFIKLAQTAQALVMVEQPTMNPVAAHQSR